MFSESDYIPEELYGKSKADVKKIYLRARKAALDLDFETALKLYSEALEYEPQSSRLLYLKAVVLLGLRRCDEAFVCFDKLVKLDKEYEADVYFLKGNTYMREFKLPEALELYDKAIEAEPFHYDAMLFKGGVLLTMGRKEAAIETLRCAMETAREIGDAEIMHSVKSFLKKMDKKTKFAPPGFFKQQLTL